MLPDLLTAIIVSSAVTITAILLLQTRDALIHIYTIKSNLKYIHFNTGIPVHDAYLSKLHMQVHRTSIPPELVHAVDENILKLTTKLTKA